MSVRFYHKTAIFFAMMLMLSGCAALPLRETSIDPPVAAKTQGGAGFHFTIAILHALQQNIDAAIEAMGTALALDPDSPYLAKELASLYAEKGDVTRAIEIGREILQRHPDDVETRLLLGGLYMGRKDYREAEAEYRRVIGLDPGKTAAHFYLGTSLAEMKKSEEAAAALQELLKIDPDHFMGNYFLARLMAEMKRYDEAEAGFKKTLSLRPSIESAMIELALLYEQQKKIPEAIEIYRNYIDQFPERLHARVRLGELYLQEQRYDEAEAVFQAVLALDIKNREVRTALALLHLQRGRHQQAIEIFSRLTEEYPAEHRLVYLLGTVYEETGDDAKAIDTLRGIPAAADQFGNARIRIGMILKKQRRLADAIASLRQAIRVRGDIPGLYALLASIHEEEKETAAAEELIREGLRVNPGSVDLQFSLGVLFEKTDRFDDSIAAMKAVLEIEPDHAEALNFIGYLYADRGIQLEEAERMIRRALQLKPGNGYIIDSLGWVLFRTNRFDEAIRYLKEAAALLPEDAAILEHLGDVYSRTGQTDDAEEAYRKAIRFNPGNESLQRKLDGLVPRKKSP